jgi:NAD(P)-dependent dehydrogenase (short-subunit alcohol dehydrogenase family)
VDRLSDPPQSSVNNAVPGVLRGRRVLVTGAASGIGSAVAQAFERAGAQALRADRAAADEVVRCDVRSERDVSALFRNANPGLTDVVHCAGIALTAPIEEVSLELWHEIVETNLTGSFLVGREFARSLIGNGTLSFIASAGGLTGAPNYTAYGASKFGVVGLMRCLALELAPRGLRVNAVCPGGVQTPMVDKTLAQDAARTGVDIEELRRREDDVVPLGRMATPDEIADVCVFLASDLARHVAGSTLLVDGAQNA